MCSAWRNYSYAYARMAAWRGRRSGRSLPDQKRGSKRRTAVRRRFTWFSLVRLSVWSGSVKSPSKNVRGDGDGGDVFRSRPEQILQIIRTWRRDNGGDFVKKRGAFFRQAADFRARQVHICVVCRVALRTLHLFQFLFIIFVL